MRAAAPLFSGREMHQLIPQREPMVMVDALFAVSEDEAETGLTVLRDNLFVQDGRLAAAGIIEHAAQSAAAVSGYRALSAGKAPKIGLIGEIKHYSILSEPPVGANLRTTLRLLAEAGGTALVSIETVSEEGPVAAGRIKIHIDEDA